MENANAIDLTDFVIYTKKKLGKNVSLKNAVGAIERKFSRYKGMYDDGAISEKAFEVRSQEHLTDLSRVYAEHSVVGWEGEFRDEKLPDYSIEEFVKIFSDVKNIKVLTYIIDKSLEEKDRLEKQLDKEAKNSKASSTGN